MVGPVLKIDRTKSGISEVYRDLMKSFKTFLKRT